MQIKIGTFSKEINSTKRPNVSSWATIDVQLKDGVSFLSPILKIQDSVWTTGYNYCYIPSWGRYYYLADAVIAPGGIWYVSATVDVLASWKTNILASSAYVRRSESNYSNYMEDSTWSHTSTPTVSHSTIDVGLNSTGVFLLFVASNDGQSDAHAIPSLSVYVMSQGALKNICNYMFSTDFYNSVIAGIPDQTLSGLSKTFFNPFQYVVKCLWLPIDRTSLPQTENKTVNFGWWESSVYAPILTGHKIKKTFTFTQGVYNDWTDRNAAWTNTTLYVPGFGQITLSPDFQGKTISGEISIDLATGTAGLFLFSDGGALVQSATGQLGAEIQLSGLYEDIISDFGSKSSAVKTGVQALGGAISSVVQNSGGAFKRMLDNFANASAAGYSMGYGVQYDPSELTTGNVGEIAESAVKGAQATLQPTMSTIGANGTRAIIEEENSAILTITKFNRYEDVHSRLGGVCNKNINPLSTLSGYTEIVNPHIDLPATAVEVTSANQFLTGGFYIE